MSATEPFDVRDLRTRGRDRRQAPRRSEEVQLHYCTQALLAAALIWSETPDGGGEIGTAQLMEAALSYRSALDAFGPVVEP